MFQFFRVLRLAIACGKSFPIHRLAGQKACLLLSENLRTASTNLQSVECFLVVSSLRTIPVPLLRGFSIALPRFVLPCWRSIVGAIATSGPCCQSTDSSVAAAAAAAAANIIVSFPNLLRQSHSDSLHWCQLEKSRNVVPASPRRGSQGSFPRSSFLSERCLAAQGC